MASGPIPGSNWATQIAHISVAPIPPVANFTSDVTTTCTGVVNFSDLSSGTPTSWAWTFGDGGTSNLQNPQHTYLANGTYTVVLTATNANGSNTKTITAYVTVNKPAGPGVTATMRCGPGTAILTAATNDSITWYNSAGTAVSQANPYTTPSLSANTIYYAEARIPQATPTYFLGPADSSLGTGSSGSFFTGLGGVGISERTLTFNVNQACTLLSVYIYAATTTSRTFELLNSSGTVLQTLTTTVPLGGSRVTLNFNLPVGTQYQLGLSDTENLYRNITGANYPYTDAGGLVTITGNNVPDGAHYYFFYNWEVQKAAANCISLRTADTVTINPAVSATVTPRNVACFNGGNGEATATVTGGTPGFTYHWGGSQTTDSISVGTGTYNVTVTDTKGCTATASGSVTVPTSALSVTATGAPALCGALNGSANAHVTGGTAGYRYHWNGGATTDTIQNLGAGTYSITVTDANGCTAASSTTVTTTGGLVLTPQHKDVTCHGAGNGNASINVTSGATPYRYYWSVGATTDTIVGLSGNSYSVTVTDAVGCTSTASVTVTDPPALTVTLTPDPAHCGSLNGSVAAAVTGGVPGYTYTWNTAATASAITGLSPATYSVTVADANLCSLTSSATVSASALLGLTDSVTNISCPGQTNGVVVASSYGGTAPYQYAWSTGPSGTVDSLTGLPGGNYTVTATDNTGCSATLGFTVTVPSAISVTTTPVSAHCGSANGSIIVSSSGGIAGYTYLWGNGTTNDTLPGVASGNYLVTVTDSRGCTTTATTLVPGTPAVTVTTSETNPSCHGGGNGIARANGTGGTAPLTYLWSAGGSLDSITNLAAGTYTVTVHDIFNCSVVQSVVVSDPTSISASISTVSPTCYGENNGNATITSVNGGAGGYTYLWSDGTTTTSDTGIYAGAYSVTVFDQNNCSLVKTGTVTGPTAITPVINITQLTCNGGNTGSISIASVTGGAGGYTYNWSSGGSTMSINNLGSGTYTVTISDSRHCSLDSSISIVTALSINLAASSQDVTCFGEQNGSITVSVSAGSPPYFYHWSNGGTAATISDLTSGQYIVTVSDTSLCAAVDTVDITAPTTSISLAINYSPIYCYGSRTGSASVVVSGGTPGYTYHWSNIVNNSNNYHLAAGTYIVTVFDANLCTATGTVNITQPQQAVSVTATSTNTVQGQATGTAILSVTGGTPPYSTGWSDGNNGDAISGLAEGVYDYSVTDINGCVDTGSVTINSVAGIGQVASAIIADVFPNPTTGVLNIRLHLPDNSHRITIAIHDVLGQTLQTMDLDPAKDVETELNLSGYSTGLYFISIRSGDNNLVQKVLLEHAKD